MEKNMEATRLNLGNHILVYQAGGPQRRPQNTVILNVGLEMDP